ncbi:MAG: protein kinase [Proteobacteria bacterium]|nr:protein kinase [Pseudomonadota bacterium]
MRWIIRIFGLVLGLPLLLAGAFGLLAAYQGDGQLVFDLRVQLQDAAKAMDGTVALYFAITFEEWVAGPILRFVLAPLGLTLMVGGFLVRRGGVEDELDEEAEPQAAAVPIDKRLLKKTLRQAAAVAKKGMVVDAAEMLFSAGALDKAADYFIQAEEHARAAEIRHDQNRFIECAELYLEGGQYASAGTIFAQQEEYARAAECYLKADGKSVAAEMFEKAGDFRRAGDCYREVEFMRHAAQMYVKCKAWLLAAECLDEVYRDEALKARGRVDPKKQAELNKLVRQAGKLFDRAGKVDRAQAILEKGECYIEAAQLALRREEFAHAAELFIDAGEAEQAAEALRQLGEDHEAARIMGEYCRDNGEHKQAAEHFEEAGDLLAAGDLYRQLEEYERAGECYTRQGEHAQAAEMYRVCGDRAKAAESYENAGRFTEAAECYALSGRGDREAELLEKAEDYLGAGEVYHRDAVDDEAIKVLQKVAPESEGFAKASALLSDIFRGRGQLSLAIKKLEQALGDAEFSRENLPLYYSLATIYEDNDDARDCVEIYEKILAFDYHYKDVEKRLVQARDRVQHLPSTDSQAQENGSSRGFSQGGQPGRYQIVGELGRGGMGIVYKAKDTVLDRLVAYKVLPDTLKENPQALKNFLREAKAAAKLNHPGIVTVYDAGEQDGRYYIAMEHVDGTTLKEILRRRGVIAPAGILHVLVQVCEALSYAHEKKVVHRDIKTANTMWTRDKKAKIMDFGLAKVVEEVRNHTTVVSGTPYYMSPEQTLGKNIDHRTDIYSLGVTVFEMATGTVPFREGNIPYHHVHTPPPDIRDLRPELPEGLSGIVARCLEKDPDSRYQTTRDILDDVKRSLSDTASATQG